MSRLQLVLDAGGVIVTNLPELWREIADIAAVPYKELKGGFKQELRDTLWSGQVGEDAFWRWMNRYCPQLAIEDGRALMVKHLRVLPAFDRIPVWSEAADIHLLSNHRHEWLLPVLEPIKPFVASITISSQSGFCKPVAQIYEIVQTNLKSHERILFVDDSEGNLAPARELGWQTLLADEDGLWVRKIEESLTDRNDFIPSKIAPEKMQRTPESIFATFTAPEGSFPWNNVCGVR
ncbi:putative hydrolase of the HAD superfamily [Paenibacillus taihuensis]|uniref:Putative hydrolase of the HAD superfamily n=1 Tax=Paenibacillus taihuensis TaxID=1156355 RepID=A0A3D9R2I7_9BACL|nr:hypothetical protein [Paenibacillus taihuensis]REE69598.1 putative hydrolase of the HAD superfamily [Paenibacillus taihuensis]